VLGRACSASAWAGATAAGRTAYSFRDFHISQQLIAGVDVFLLAKNTGASIHLIG